MKRFLGVVLAIGGAVALGTVLSESIKLDVVALVAFGCGCIWLGLRLVGDES